MTRDVNSDDDHDEHEERDMDDMTHDDDDTDEGVGDDLSSCRQPKDRWEATSWSAALNRVALATWRTT